MVQVLTAVLFDTLAGDVKDASPVSSQEKPIQ
jgi:hypothetical protein